ncbi:MAG: glycosyltransferase family 2 protein [Patescibacteria group bacterium]|nr:glycosyltransferase family 2 protein [Patescibacteria group bacterium]MDE2591027.1 glycosyltransferase family 2 protein [Patescibacteria group bacterium]
MKLSIIIPVFNEEKTIQQVLDRVVAVAFPGVTKEILVVNDGSKDTTAEKIEEFIKKTKPKQFTFINQKENKGKGAAVKVGIEAATGDYIIIQDADLEYNPKDIAKLLPPVLEKKADVVYGTRLDKLPHQGTMQTGYYVAHFLGNRFLSMVTSVLYGQWLTDMETCYKLFPKDVMKKIQLYSRGFEFEPEITAKLLKLGLRFTEVPITTEPRGYEEGKKLVATKEGPKALWTLVKYRFSE